MFPIRIACRISSIFACSYIADPEIFLNFLKPSIDSSVEGRKSMGLGKVCIDAKHKINNERSKRDRPLRSILVSPAVKASEATRKRMLLPLQFSEAVLLSRPATLSWLLVVRAGRTGNSIKMK